MARLSVKCNYKVFCTSVFNQKQCNIALQFLLYISNSIQAFIIAIFYASKSVKMFYNFSNQWSDQNPLKSIACTFGIAFALSSNHH